MRTFALLLMIALLPLRLWAAEGMGARMAAAELAAATATATATAAAAAAAVDDQAIAGMDHSALAGMDHGAMPDDCPMSKHDGGDAGKSASGCLVCHLSAAPAPLAFLGEFRAQRAGPPPAAPEAFASAQPSRERKPPIS